MAEQVNKEAPLKQRDAEKLAEEDAAAVQPAPGGSKKDLLDASDELMAEIDGILAAEEEHLVNFRQLGGE